jgi:hypothetical protein
MQYATSPTPMNKPTRRPVLISLKWTSPPSFFPARPGDADIRYRTGVLIAFGAGMQSGSAAIRDASGREVSFFTGRPMYIDGKQTHCAIPPLNGHPYDPVVCDGGWPADMVIGETKVRVYYWHDVTPWSQHILVTDEIDRTQQPRRL